MITSSGNFPSLSKPAEGKESYKLQKMWVGLQSPRKKRLMELWQASSTWRLSQTLQWATLRFKVQSEMWHLRSMSPQAALLQLIRLDSMISRKVHQIARMKTLQSLWGRMEARSSLVTQVLAIIAVLISTAVAHLFPSRGPLFQKVSKVLTLTSKDRLSQSSTRPLKLPKIYPVYK